MEHNYTPHFVQFVKKGIADKYYIGTGNPNSQILYIGKESAIAKENLIAKDLYAKNALDWQTHIDNKSCEILNYPVTEDHVFRKENIWGKNTWSKYQKLTNRIFEKVDVPYHIDFLEDVFTTEINDAPNKRTNTANKNNLNERKILFKQSKFIQNFPVVILACSNYVTNNENIREIDEMFGVKYDNSFSKQVYNRTNWFFSHFNEDKSKLVIHTRQLSADVKTDLLNDMAEEIRKHLISLTIYK